jgi:hypothetical protein
MAYRKWTREEARQQAAQLLVTIERIQSIPWQERSGRDQRELQRARVRKAYLEKAYKV